MKTNTIIRNNALLIFLGITGFFFLMKLSGLANITELRLLNFIFVFIGINKAITTNIEKNNETSYISNLSIGIATSVIAVLLSIISLIIYVDFLNPEFLTVIENTAFWGPSLSLSMVVIALAIEGIASSVICGFIVMQYYKNAKVGQATV